MIHFGAKKFPQEKADKPERPTRPKTRVVKKPAHKRKTTTSSDPANDDVGKPDLEAELDSLGLLFMQFIDDATCQDDAEASHANDVEVIALPSDSSLPPSPKIRRANRKVKFSHPLAYL